MDGGRWAARGGWSIEAIVLDTTPCFRVLRHGYLISYCASLEELRELLEMNGLDLGDLVEDEAELGKCGQIRTDHVRTYLRI